MKETSSETTGEESTTHDPEDQGAIHEMELVLAKKVMETLRDLDIPAWLDQGSLLGAVRDGRFLPISWDEDVDLGLWRGNIKRVYHEFAKRLRIAGARVDFAPFSGTMMIRPTDRLEGRPVNIGAYKVRGRYAVKRAVLIKKGVEPPGGIMERAGRWVYPRVLRTGRSMTERSVTDPHMGSSQWVAICYKLGSLFIQVGLFIRFFSHKRITFRTEKQFFDSLAPFEIHGMDFLTPADPEGYLRHKYGENWHIPRRDWVFWQQDGAIIERNDG